MSNVIYINASSRTWSYAAPADTQNRSEENDLEERRWQMEWERRNVED